MRHVIIKVFGEVQGVGFRYFALAAAEKMGVAGFVRNEPDGSVYLEVEGRSDAVKQFIAWCHKGPPTAKVERIMVSEAPPEGWVGFDVR